MPAKLNEQCAYSTLYAPAVQNTTGTLYNGAGTTGSGLDTQNYDEVVFSVLVGTVTSPNTHTITIMESDDDNADNASAVTSASFTAISSANTGTSRHGYVRCADTKRYLWARMVTVGGATGTPIGIEAQLSRGRENPQTTTFDFEV